MDRIVRRVRVVVFCGALWTSFVSAEEAILPQGDPKLQESDAAEQARREEMRKNRLKQQGQSENYRVAGELQDGSKGPKANNAKGHNCQDTGIEDPSVNSAQASGLKTVRGRVLKSEEAALTIERSNDKEIVLTIDPRQHSTPTYIPATASRRL